MFDYEQYLAEYAERMYFWEIERKERIAESLTLPIGIVTLQAGAIAWYLGNLPRFSFGIIEILFFVSAIVFMFFLSQTIYFVIRVFVGFEYEYVTTPQSVQKYAEDLSVYYKAEKVENAEACIYKDLVGSLTKRYSDACKKNAESNRRRIYFLRKAKLRLIWSLIFLVLSFILFSYIQYKDARYKVQGVEIVDKGDQKMAIDQDPKDEPKEEPKKKLPLKPELGPNELVKENLDPKNLGKE